MPYPHSNLSVSHTFARDRSSVLPLRVGVRSIRGVLHSALVLGAMACSGVASAATIFGVEGSAHLWQPELSGTIGQNADAFDFATEFEGDKGDSQSVLIAVEHPVPVLPNVQVRATPLSWSGRSESATGSLGGLISFSGEVDAEFDMTALDATLYYEILDNWATLDLGLTARQLEGYIEATQSGIGSDRVDIKQIVPMGYAHVRFDLPFSGLAAGARGNVIAYEGNNLTDIEAYLHIEADLIPFVDVGLQGGIRRMSLKIEDLDDWESDATFEGAYVAVTGKF